MKEKVTAIFDIGKTNKKFFLFNESYEEVYREYTRLELTEDDDGRPAEDLSALISWMTNTLKTHLQSDKFDIRKINFSTYGASLVHLDEKGRVCTPLYNYTNPYDNDLREQFYQEYGPAETFSRITGTSDSGMLNSGMQLYWLKYRKPDVFGKIRHTLHLPQFLSYHFTGDMFCEYTSLGCHTALWDYQNNRYHSWVKAEGLDMLFPRIVPTDTRVSVQMDDKTIVSGIGIHDSSSALIPYLQSINGKFILLSTGTWNVTLNPFATGALTSEDVNCINYMRTDGSPVKASSLFLGNEYSLQVKELSRLFEAGKDQHKSVRFDAGLYHDIETSFTPMFQWKSIETESSVASLSHATFEAAYHQLVYELARLQADTIRLTSRDTGVHQLYIDGGFGDNDVFVGMLSLMLPEFSIHTTRASLGSALGAALVLGEDGLPEEFLEKTYQLQSAHGH